MPPALKASHPLPTTGWQMHGYATANNAYTETAVMTATPGQLVVLLYEGALRHLGRAAHAMRVGESRAALASIRRVEAILDELNLSLDMGYGEIPERLRAVYLFSKRLLSEAVLERDAERIDRVAGLLGELHESWSELAARAEHVDAPAA